MKNNRMETLKNAGIDTSKYFTLVVENDIPKGTRISFAIDTEANPVAKEIVENGYVKNTRLHRRFVAAHYMRLLESRDGWHRTMNRWYDYMYQYDMMLEEVRVLSKLEKQRSDYDVFGERKQFFTIDTAHKILASYVKDLRTYLGNLNVRHCKGKPYVRIPSYGDVFIDELEREVIEPIETMIRVCKRAYTYETLYEAFKTLRKMMIKLPYNTKKSKVWINAFQSAGAFYTLKNLIMFHDVRLYYNGRFYGMNESMQLLKELAKTYEGYQLNGLLKEAIDKNHFDFKRSIEAHK